MVAVFAPQFFLVLGVDFFLAGAIASIFLESRLPKFLTWIMILGSFIGFIQLMVSPGNLDRFSDELQFYYCMGFAMISVTTLLVENCFLIIASRKPLQRTSLMLGGIFAIFLTVPTSLILLFFTSAYVNKIPVPLPALPAVPLAVIYIAFLASVSILIALVVISYLEEMRRSKIRVGK